MCRRIAPLLFGFLALLNTPGCTGTKPTITHAPGSRPFTFAVDSVTELTLSKNDPEQSDHWSARVERRGVEAWTIASAPEGRALLDHLADHRYIKHLLDTLTSVTVEKAAPQGPLSSFGLDRPWFSLRWSGYEFKIGQIDTQTGGRFAQIGSSDPIIIKGAVIGMLGYLDRFDVLRHRNLLPLTLDDIAQVNNIKRQNSAYPPKIEAWLQQLTHLRVQEFLDDPAQSQKLAAQINSAPSWKIQLQGRLGEQTWVKARKLNGEVYATLSSRPEAPFRLHSRAAQILQPPSQ